MKTKRKYRRNKFKSCDPFSKEALKSGGQVVLETAKLKRHRREGRGMTKSEQSFQRLLEIGKNEEELGITKNTQSERKIGESVQSFVTRVEGETRGKELERMRNLKKASKSTREFYKRRRDRKAEHRKDEKQTELDRPILEKIAFNDVALCPPTSLPVPFKTKR